MHVSDSELIRSDSSITGSYTCDKSGTRVSSRERLLKAVKMEFEWHPGDPVCICGLIPTFVSEFGNAAPDFPSLRRALSNFTLHYRGLWNYRFIN